MNIVKKFLPVALLLLGVFVVGLGVVGAQDDGLTFAMVSHGGVGNPFWIVVIKGMEDACALLEAECLCHLDSRRMVELDVTGIGFVDREGAAMVRSLVEKGVRLVGTRALVEALLRCTAT